MNTQHYWDERWQSGQTGWDIGYASPPIMDYMRQYGNKQAAILVPGCGNAYEASALADAGFTSITLIDIAPALVAALQQQVKDKPAIQVICTDFFVHQGQYDIILEQTFFCAIDPSRRIDYVRHAASLLKPGGLLTGVLFNRHFEQAGPPHGGTIEEYEALFSPLFTIDKMEPCYNSITPRAGAELFIRFCKK